MKAAKLLPRDQPNGCSFAPILGKNPRVSRTLFVGEGKHQLRNFDQLTVMRASSLLTDNIEGQQCSVEFDAIPFRFGQMAHATNDF